MSPDYDHGDLIFDASARFPVPHCHFSRDCSDTDNSQQEETLRRSPQAQRLRPHKEKQKHPTKPPTVISGQRYLGDRACALLTFVRLLRLLRVFVDLSAQPGCRSEALRI